MQQWLNKLSGKVDLVICYKETEEDKTVRDTLPLSL